MRTTHTLRAIAVISVVLVLWTFPVSADSRADTAGVPAGKTEHDVYLPNTDHELHVYRIYGRHPGKTVLIIGGIHGNEPGGYLAADSYVDITLKRGNLIVVPRANLRSILENSRGLNGDYNRKFAADLKPSNNDDKIISVLKNLMEQSDLLLNLHDGSGFYRKQWVDEMHNPYRYGQSIIADCESFLSKSSGHRIELGSLARRVVQRVNAEIKDDRYLFSFANHDSVSPDTKYPEMRKTATYYALTTHHIPAFGIETSKSLPTDEMKVAHQILVINAFLDEFGVEMDVPFSRVEPPHLDYLVVDIDGRNQVVVRDGGELTVPTGSVIKIDHIVGNYERHLFADVVGVGGRNDNGLSVTVNRPLSIIVRKDSSVFGRVRIAPGSDGVAAGGYGPSEALGFLISVDGSEQFVKEGESLDIIRGQELRVVDFISTESKRGVNVNFEGFVGNPQDNKGEDRGYTIRTATDLLPDWSLDKKGLRYSIVAKRGREELASMTLNLHEPQIHYIFMQEQNVAPVTVPVDQPLNIQPGKTVQFLQVHSTVPLKKSDLVWRLELPDGDSIRLEQGIWRNPAASPGARLSITYGNVKLVSVPLHFASITVDD